MSYSLCFVMPAYRRYNLSQITFAQRRWVCDVLTHLGVKADCVVIGDDENLDIAHEFGFHTVKCDNRFLGKKFNDGHEFAGKSGYDYSIPVGSDMFLYPDVFLNLGRNFTITNYYAVMRRNGSSLATMDIEWGVLQIIPTRMTEVLDHRPCVDYAPKGCDSLTRRRIKNRLLEKMVIDVQRVHQYECVSFQSMYQITDYKKLVEATGAQIAIGKPQTLLQGLKKWYPVKMVDGVIEYYNSGQSLR